jgi:hypothetical protein
MISKDMTNNEEKERNITIRRRSGTTNRRMENFVARCCESGLSTSQLVLGRGNKWEEAGREAAPPKPDLRVSL